MNFKTTFGLIALGLLPCAALPVRAQNRVVAEAPRQLKSLTSRDLLSRYGKPMAVCILDGDGTQTNKSLLPEGVALFAPDKAPDWAKAALFSPQNQGEIIYLYKRPNCAVSYSLDRLGFVTACCVAGLQGKPIAANGREFDVLSSSRVTLGDEFRYVITRYGYPDDILSFAHATYELRYIPEAGSILSQSLTIRNNRVVRLYFWPERGDFTVPSKPDPNSAPPKY